MTTMTYTLEKATAWVETTIADFESTINFANDTDREWYGDSSVEGRRQYALNSMKQEYDMAFGAINFCLCYLHGITDDEFERLFNRLFEEYHRYRNEAWDRIV